MGAVRGATAAAAGAKRRRVARRGPELGTGGSSPVVAKGRFVVSRMWSSSGVLTGVSRNGH